MNNQPVAYINEKDGLVCAKCYKPFKTLTDFEIKGVLALDECWIGEDSSMPNMIAFARAILRKAQEK